MTIECTQRVILYILSHTLSVFFSRKAPQLPRHFYMTQYLAPQQWALLNFTLNFMAGGATGEYLMKITNWTHILILQTNNIQRANHWKIMSCGLARRKCVYNLLMQLVIFIGTLYAPYVHWRLHQASSQGTDNECYICSERSQVFLSICCVWFICQFHQAVGIEFRILEFTSETQYFSKLEIIDGKEFLYGIHLSRQWR